MYVDQLLGNVPDEISDEDYEKIESSFLAFRKIFTNTLHEPYNKSKAPSWYVIVGGQVVTCEGYYEIPEFQGRETEIATLIESALNQ